jgi:hypothetical protein
MRNHIRSRIRVADIHHRPPRRRMRKSNSPMARNSPKGAPEI